MMSITRIHKQQNIGMAILMVLREKIFITKDIWNMMLRMKEHFG